MRIYDNHIEECNWRDLLISRHRRYKTRWIVSVASKPNVVQLIVCGPWMINIRNKISIFLLLYQITFCSVICECYYSLEMFSYFVLLATRGRGNYRTYAGIIPKQTFTISFFPHVVFVCIDQLLFNVILKTGLC